MDKMINQPPSIYDGRHKSEIKASNCKETGCNATKNVLCDICVSLQLLRSTNGQLWIKDEV